jgi:transposase
MAQQKHHSVAFQDEACKLVAERGYTQRRAAAELGVSDVTLRAWLKKRGLLKPVEVVEPDYLASDDPRLLKTRIKELEKRLRRSEAEKEILKKATAFFASQSP